MIQYIYRKYGRERAGLAATVIHYRARSAVREVGKALGLSLDTLSALSSTVWGWRSGPLNENHIREVGLDPADERLALTIELAGELTGFPRHLSQHVGGFVITRGPLSEIVPITNAAMEERTVIEWDKDDLDALGMLKIDVLGLGMLTCIRKGLDLLRTRYGIDYGLADIPAEDPAVYDMLCEADSIGVFQVESRAQMSMLPRLRPRSFYDLVIEVAIVRPGPIQGDMVHPYLRRRNGEETVEFPSDALRGVLEKTLGVPLFQEQAMKIAIVAAGFTPSEADRLRRAMATFRHVGTIGKFRTKLIEGMVRNGYERDFAERCFRQIEGFGDYGFPESHAASFALLVYVSAWLKMPPPRGLRRGHSQQPADGLLRSRPAGARRQGARGFRPPGRRQPFGMELHARRGGRRRSAACAAPRFSPGQGHDGGERRRDRRCPRPAGPPPFRRSGRTAGPQRAPGPGSGNPRRGRCLRLDRPHAAPGALGRPRARSRAAPAFRRHRRTPSRARGGAAGDEPGRGGLTGLRDDQDVAQGPPAGADARQAGGRNASPRRAAWSSSTTARASRSPASPWSASARAPPRA